jgi:peptidoglycan/xylan/chitin deacetylase (PgdA/CDA1 family)
LNPGVTADGLTHPGLQTLAADEIREELRRTGVLIEELTGTAPR